MKPIASTGRPDDRGPTHERQRLHSDVRTNPVRGIRGRSTLHVISRSAAANRLTAAIATRRRGPAFELLSNANREGHATTLQAMPVFALGAQALAATVSAPACARQTQLPPLIVTPALNSPVSHANPAGVPCPRCHRHESYTRRWTRLTECVVAPTLRSSVGEANAAPMSCVRAHAKGHKRGP
jgi:hypothetical protein